MAAPKAPERSEASPKKRKRMILPGQRSMMFLRRQGAPLVASVGKWNPHARFARKDGSIQEGARQDLWGFIDVIAVEKGLRGILGVQATTAAHVSDRLEKILYGRAKGLQKGKSGGPRLVDRAFHFVMAGNRLEIHGWSRKRGNDGHWRHTVKRVLVTPEELARAKSESR